MKYFLLLLLLTGCAATPPMYSLIVPPKCSPEDCSDDWLKDFCEDAALLVCRPGPDLLDRYFPVATPQQQQEAGYHPGSRPGLPSFLSQQCLDKRFGPQGHLCAPGENPYGLSQEELARRRAEHADPSILHDEQQQRAWDHPVWVYWLIGLLLGIGLMIFALTQERLEAWWQRRRKG